VACPEDKVHSLLDSLISSSRAAEKHSYFDYLLAFFWHTGINATTSKVQYCHRSRIRYLSKKIANFNEIPKLKKIRTKIR